MSSSCTIITACIAASALLSALLWGAQIGYFDALSNGAAFLGLACSVIAAVLTAVLLYQHRRELDHLNRMNKSKLDSCKLENANALAAIHEETHREMDSFRSNLSHSLRMPVAIIQGYAELLASGMIKDEAVAIEYLEKINQRSQYMTEAISRQFSSSDSIGSSKLSLSKLDLLHLIQLAAADMQAAAEEKGIKIQVLSSEREILMEGDAYLLDRVLFNLLENALKYIGRPGIITIRAIKKGQEVSLLIQDDGLGLPSEETQHIFDANYQGSNHITGQGYGLYLVRRAVEAHGGSISARSAPGRGMGITITLPLHVNIHRAEEEAQTGSADPQHPSDEVLA